MKKIILFVLMTAIFSCTKELAISSLVERNGLVYEVNSSKPYSGKVFEKHENGAFSLKGTYHKGLKSEQWTKYADNEQVLSIENYNKEGLLDGEFKKYDISGQIIRESFYKNNLNEGLESFWKADGKPTSSTEYKDGIKNGIAKSYRNGILNTEAHYKNDLLHEEFKEY